MKNFSELPLSQAVQDNLVRNNLIVPTPVQAQSIPPGLDGRDIVATAQTGTGKTLAFVIPIIERLVAQDAVKGIQALILSPTRELAIQIREAYEKVARGTGAGPAAVVVGGMNENAQLSQIRRGASVVIATPGRLFDYLGRKLINLRSVKVLVLDEADRMLDMGFLPTIQRILAELPQERQTLFYSATIDESISQLIRKHLKDPVRIAIAPATKTPEQIDLHIYEVAHDRKLGLLKHMLDSEEGSFLVFARTKHGTDRLTRKLSSAGVRAAAMHGDRTQNQRNQALDGFRQGRYRVLVATDVAARGIHVDSVAHVINYDLPQAPEDFIHRIGRTGRAGQRGTASTFSLPSERGQIRQIERTLKKKLLVQSVADEIQDEQTLLASVPEHKKVVEITRPPAARESKGSRKPFGKRSGTAAKAKQFSRDKRSDRRFA